jgi:hypothetical protein
MLNFLKNTEFGMLKERIVKGKYHKELKGYAKNTMKSFAKAFNK